MRNSCPGSCQEGNSKGKIKMERQFNDLIPGKVYYARINEGREEISKKVYYSGNGLIYHRGPRGKPIVDWIIDYKFENNKLVIIARSKTKLKKLEANHVRTTLERVL